MNIDNPLLDHSIPDVRSLIEKASACATIFKTQDSVLLQQAIDDLFESLTLSLETSTDTTLLLLNLRDKHRSFLTNTILKTVLVTSLLSLHSRYGKTTARRLVTASLLILYTITPYLLSVRKNPSLFNRYVNTFKHAASLCFKQVKNIYIKEPDILRLISQIANINEFSSKNQLCQSIVIVGLNSAITTNSGVFGSSALTADNALMRSLTLKNYICPKPFTSIYTNNFIGVLPLLASGKLCVLANGTAVIVGQQRVNDEFINNVTKRDIHCVPYIKSKGIYQIANGLSISQNMIRFVLPQQAVDFTSISSKWLQCTLDLPLESKPLIYESKTRYMPPSHLESASKALLSETNQLIADYLSQDSMRSSLVMQYAQHSTRVMQPISSIKHAIALLGMIRIFPVVCISEMQVAESHNLAFGEYEIINKEEMFAKVANIITKTFNFDIPEYVELLARVVFQGLMLIPKSRYAASVSTLLGANDEMTISLNTAFGQADAQSWFKTSKQLATKWKLPKLYLSSTTSFFEVKSGRLALSNLPNKTKQIVASLILSEWVLTQWLRGEHKIRNINDINSTIKDVGILPTELQSLYQKLIESISPSSSLI